MIFALFPKVTRLRKLRPLLAFYQRSGLQSLVRHSGVLGLLPRRLQAMETRLSGMEGALGSLVQAVSRRQELMQPPDAPQLTQEASRTPSLAQVK